MPKIIANVTNLTLKIPVAGFKQKKSAAKSRQKRIVHDHKGRALVVALKKISFTIEVGDTIGLIGRNGAGKSCLLRVLAGIYQPTVGQVQINGRISTLFTSNLGMHPEATGIENIYRMGTVLGMKKEKVDTLLPSILDFCDLGEFIEFPVRTYSAGMKMRLGFAISTSAHPDILLIDEVFGTGDRSFQKLARERIHNLMGRANTLVMASHSHETLKSFCNKILWIENGKIVSFGVAEDVLSEYENVNAPKTADHQATD